MNLAIPLLAAALTAQAAAASVADPAPPPTAGDAALQRGDLEAAHAAYARAAQAAPADVNANLGLARVELYANDLTSARAHLRRAAATAPGDQRVGDLQRSLESVEPRAGDFQLAMQPSGVIVPFVTTDPLPMVRASINGHAALLVIDTGAHAIELSVDAAQRFGVDLHPAGVGTFAGGRQARTTAGRIDTVSFPGLTIRGIPAGGLPAAMPTELGGHHFDGFLGTTLLRQFVSTLDYRGGTLILRSQSVSAQFESAAAARGATIVPMWLAPDHFIFARAHVNDAPDSLFSIDTGGAGIGVSLTKGGLDAAHIALDEAHAASGIGGGGSVRVIPFTATSVALGAFTQRDVPGVASPGGDPYGIFPFAVSGALTHGFFRNVAVTFDFTAMKLIVQ